MGALTPLPTECIGAQTHVSAVRLVVCIIWMLHVATTPYGDFSILPVDSASGYGLGRFLFSHTTVRTVIWSPAVLSALKWSAVILLVGAVTMPRRHGLLIMSCVSVVLLDLLSKAVGAYANHAQFLPLSMMVIFAIGGPRDYLGIGQLIRCVRQAGPGASAHDLDGNWTGFESLLAAMVALPYVYIAINRFVEGGVALFLGDSVCRYIIVGCQSNPNAACLAMLSAFGSSCGLGIRTGFLFATVWECGAVLAVYGGRWAQLWLVGVLTIHAFTWLAMGILFWENMAIAAVVFGLGRTGYRLAPRP